MSDKFVYRYSDEISKSGFFQGHTNLSLNAYDDYIGQERRKNHSPSKQKKKKKERDEKIFSKVAKLT